MLVVRDDELDAGGDEVALSEVAEGDARVQHTTQKGQGNHV